MANRTDMEMLKTVDAVIKGASLEMLFLLEDTIIKRINDKKKVEK